MLRILLPHLDPRHGPRNYVFVKHPWAPRLDVDPFTSASLRPGNLDNSLAVLRPSASDATTTRGEVRLIKEVHTRARKLSNFSMNSHALAQPGSQCMIKQSPDLPE